MSLMNKKEPLSLLTHAQYQEALPAHIAYNLCEVTLAHALLAEPGYTDTDRTLHASQKMYALVGIRAGHLAFVSLHEAPLSHTEHESLIASAWPRDILVRDTTITQIPSHLPRIALGTAFQKRVWESLCAVPYGTTISYQALAQRIGSPRGARAVGNAVGANKIALVIPCHRVVREGTNDIGGYRWGSTIKEILLTHEGGRAMKEKKLANERYV